MKKSLETIILLDCGCEEIQALARLIRRAHIYCLVMPSTVSVERLRQENPVGLIICRGNDKTARCQLPIVEQLKLPALELHVPDAACLEKKAGEALAFCQQDCACSANWKMSSFLEESLVDIRRKVGSETVVLGLSGGVDSSVVAALLHKAIGSQLTCVFVNNGLLRKNEAEQVQELFGRNFAMRLHYVDASQRFLKQLKGISDPETKRKIIGKEFIEVFSQAALESKATFLGQGTIYPDIIESVAQDGNPASVIKSHHNVGGLPENMPFKLIEPIARLFKDEVRELGALLGLPSELLDRHPFPGPSLGVRHLGAIEPDTLEMLRQADAIVVEELYTSGWYHKTWQALAVFLPVRAVGIKKGKRAYEHVIAIRAVNSIDAVTAQVTRLPWKLLERMSCRIINEVDGISRVVYDTTPKPPGTIEWE